MAEGDIFKGIFGNINGRSDNKFSGRGREWNRAGIDSVERIEIKRANEKEGEREWERENDREGIKRTIEREQERGAVVGWKHRK